jgi:hypothetical protein
MSDRAREEKGVADGTEEGGRRREKDIHCAFVKPSPRAYAMGP